MSTKNSRIMVSLPPEWEPEILKVKQEIFYNISTSEMYRKIIRLGLDETRKGEVEKTDSNTV